MAVTHYDIEAFIDSELGWIKKIRVYYFIHSNINAFALYQSIKHQKNLLQELYKK